MGTPYRKEQLLVLVSESGSITEAAKRLGVCNSSGMRDYLKDLLEHHGIATDHWEPSPRKAGVTRHKIPWENMLVSNRTGAREYSKTLRRAMVESGLSYVCSTCGISNKWANKTLILQIDHINGDNLDNRPANLRFLCPNCHSQTTGHSVRRRRYDDAPTLRGLGAGKNKTR